VTPSAAIARLRAVRPGMRILVLLKHADRDQTIEALDAGADAVLARTASEIDLREATVRLANGQRYVSPDLLAVAFDSNGARTERDRFTEREREVLTVLVEGLSNREIADKLFIGEATVKTHLRNIYDKLGVSNRAQAVGRAMQEKILS
jgi:DNA-binding NarL/FixJ family response regulator